ncbi:MAG TPA: DUF6058 family natural product biosynthesis protein [Gaiellaceae bacterium]|nr:DUF6058 family natural product biosynthesis protein [Gaiellaceae bacterium]
MRRLIADGLLPRPSYVLPDGSEMVPDDYFRLLDDAGEPKRLREEFSRRYQLAGGATSEFEEDWADYIGGIYGVCLRQVSPETIVRKSELVASIERLLASPAADDATWRERLRQEVDELDILEREFSPDYDRTRFGRPPSRDRLIGATRERFPELFAEVGAHGG